MSDRTTVIVLAHDLRQFRQKVRDIRERSARTYSFVYGDDVERIRMVEPDKVITCDGFWDREDAIELATAAQERMQ